MRVPDLLYRLARAPGSLGPLIELFTKRVDASASSTTVSSNLTGLAKDKILVITNITADLDPGATQAVIRVVIQARTPAGVTFAIAQRGFAAVADLRSGFDWQGEVALGGRGVDVASIFLDGVFDAGVNANATTLSVFGYVIPRGNVAPF